LLRDSYLIGYTRRVMAKEGASFFSWRGDRSADARSWAIVDEVPNEKRLKVLDVGEGVKVPEPDATGYAYSLYSEAWKEFDRLEKLAKRDGAAGWIEWAWAWSGIFPALGLFAPHRVPRKDSVTLIVGFAILGVIQLLRSDDAKRQLTHWPCPRCHAEWPGKKLEKEPRCATCGLTLHQMTP
jgi:hypothetical protein